MALIYGLDFKYVHPDTYTAPRYRKDLRCSWIDCQRGAVYYWRSCMCSTDDDDVAGCPDHGFMPICHDHMVSELNLRQTAVISRYFQQNQDGFSLSA